MKITQMPLKDEEDKCLSDTDVIKIREGMRRQHNIALEKQKNGEKLTATERYLIATNGGEYPPKGARTVGEEARSAGFKSVDAWMEATWEQSIIDSLDRALLRKEQKEKARMQANKK